jgi:hypothetical protein
MISAWLCWLAGCRVRHVTRNSRADDTDVGLGHHRGTAATDVLGVALPPRVHEESPRNDFPSSKKRGTHAGDRKRGPTPLSERDAGILSVITRRHVLAARL